MPRRPRAPKDGHTLAENLGTQPLTRHRVFNNPEVLTEGWFPVCPATALRRGQARSFELFKQRVVLFRGEDGRARAMDAFCPHMGADLGNGAVIGNELRCYFHRWRFDESGAVCHVPGQDKLPANAKNVAYPVEEKYGFLWVYSGPEAPYPVPSPPGLDGEPLEAWHIGAPLLYAHHHVMMAGGIDLAHFSAVHDLDIDFDFTVEEGAQSFEWRLEGAIPSGRAKYGLMKRLVGPRVGYHARFAGGSIVTLSYGPDQRLGGVGRKLPPLHLLWGCVPERSGVSRVHVFVVTRRRPGLFGWLSSALLKWLTIALLVLLRDDDVKAFPNMRFNPKNLVEADRSVARFIQLTDKLPLSAWSGPGHPRLPVR